MGFFTRKSSKSSHHHSGLSTVGAIEVAVEARGTASSSNPSMSTRASSGGISSRRSSHGHRHSTRSPSSSRTSQMSTRAVSGGSRTSSMSIRDPTNWPGSISNQTASGGSRTSRMSTRDPTYGSGSGDNHISIEMLMQHPPTCGPASSGGGSYNRFPMAGPPPPPTDGLPYNPNYNVYGRNPNLTNEQNAAIDAFEKFERWISPYN